MEKAIERLALGNNDLDTLIPIISKSILDPEYGVKFTDNGNELLGIKMKGQDFWKELISPLVTSE